MKGELFQFLVLRSRSSNTILTEVDDTALTVGEKRSEPFVWRWW